MRRILRLASNRLVVDPGAAYIYPYSVDLSVSPPPAKVSVSEGDAHGAHGTDIGVDEALTEAWSDHFARAEAKWLLPYLRRLQRGETVHEWELVADFERRHGRAPEIVEWWGE